MRRRDFLLSLLASGAAPLCGRAGPLDVPNDLKIEAVDVLVTNPPPVPSQNFTPWPY